MPKAEFSPFSGSIRLSVELKEMENEDLRNIAVEALRILWRRDISKEDQTYLIGFLQSCLAHPEGLAKG